MIVSLAGGSHSSVVMFLLDIQMSVRAISFSLVPLKNKTRPSADNHGPSSRYAVVLIVSERGTGIVQASSSVRRELAKTQTKGAAAVAAVRATLGDGRQRDERGQGCDQE